MVWILFYFFPLLSFGHALLTFLYSTIASRIYNFFFLFFSLIKQQQTNNIRYEDTEWNARDTCCWWQNGHIHAIIKSPTRQQKPTTCRIWNAKSTTKEEKENGHVQNILNFVVLVHRGGFRWCYFRFICHPNKEEVVQGGRGRDVKEVDECEVKRYTNGRPIAGHATKKKVRKLTIINRKTKQKREYPAFLLVLMPFP